MGGHERDYIERTIATVRNHRDADNCWPQWANIFADEIEAQWAECGRLREQLAGEQFNAKSLTRQLMESEALADRLREQLDAARQALEVIADHSIVSERGPDEDCDWHCTAELVALARAALGVEGPAA